MASTSETNTVPSTPAEDIHKARAGDRGATSGRNVAQNRAIGQDDPMGGSRMGRERLKTQGYPGSGDEGDGAGTDAAQVAEAEALKRKG